jgi:hypothetical protein
VATASGGRDGKEIPVTTSLERIGRLASVLAVLTLLPPGAARAGTLDFSTKAAMERHFQHEDRIYATRSDNSPVRTSAEAMAMHFTHEDAIYSARHRLSPPTGTSAKNGFRRSAAFAVAGATLLVLCAAAMVTARRGRAGRRLLQG